MHNLKTGKKTRGYKKNSCPPKFSLHSHKLGVNQVKLIAQAERQKKGGGNHTTHEIQLDSVVTFFC
jgi:hypothetical protein